MKNIKRIIILIFFDIVLIKSVLCQIPNPGNYADPRIVFGENARSMLALKNNNDQNTNSKRYLISEFIKESLISSYFIALANVENDLNEIVNMSGNGIPTREIQNAIQKLIGELKKSSTTKRVIVLRFEFDSDELDKFGRNLDNFVYPQSPNPGEEKRIGNKDGYGKTNSNNFIYIYNAYTDFTWKCIKTINGNCEYKFAYLYSNSRVPNSANLMPWGECPPVEFSLPSAILHELIHIVLRQSTNSMLNNEANGRYADEASVEDIMLKIFPREAGGFNAYEYTYYANIWNERISRTFPGISTSLRRFLGNFQYKSNFYSRKFNPPCDANYLLKYFKIENQIGTYVIHGNNYCDRKSDGWVADDCRDLQLQRYVIPYKTCCDQ